MQIRGLLLVDANHSCQERFLESSMQTDAAACNVAFVRADAEETEGRERKKERKRGDRFIFGDFFPSVQQPPSFEVLFAACFRLSAVLNGIYNENLRCKT